MINKNKKVYIALIVSLIITLIVCARFSLIIFSNINASDIGTVTIYGSIIKVNSIKVTDVGYVINAYVEVLDGELSGSVIQTYFNSSNLLHEGYKVEFSGVVNALNFYANNYVNSKNLRYGVNYVCNNSNILNVDTNINNVFNYAKHLLYQRLSYSNAENYEFIFALLTGDTNFIKDLTLNKFRDVGVAHIFAVSGLHIGFLYAFINLIFKPFKFNKVTKYVLTLVLLYLYVAFCGTTPSCLRAFIIIAVSSFSKAFGFKNDRLSSIFFSMVLVLTINSADLFNVGFYLSYLACLSLVFLTPKIEKLLNYILPQRVCKFVAPFISAYVGTLPITNDFFLNSSLLSMLFNAFIVPLMSFVFILCFISSVIIMLFSNALFIMQISSFFVSLIVWYVNTFSFIVLKTTVLFSISTVFYYFGLVLCSGVINVKLKTVKIISLVNFVIFLLVFLLINI
ncbi:MAG: ComEC/Rec2 family competence protein [Clostridia bacterium]|nr:ComEC/Rec2 family competence protein [Clostridia bacterium]